MDKLPNLALGLFAGLLFVTFFFNSTSAEFLTKTGDEYFGGSRPHSLFIANLLYRISHVLDKDNPHTLHQRARISFIRGDFNEALSLITLQLERHGTEFMSSYYIRGLVHGYRKEFAEAERDFKTFLIWDPENWAALNDLAWVYFAQGKFEEAAEASAAGLRVAPQNPWLLTMRAMSLFNLGEREEAERLLTQARVEALTLTENDWIRAYPGNDPINATQGLFSLRSVLEENLELVRGVN